MNRSDVDVSGTAQFEGRTAEEAVARARAALGDAGALRCWKTRRGGVGGFFAKEVFVAWLTPPPGSEATRGKASRAEPDRREAVPDRDPVADAAPRRPSAPEPIRREDEDSQSARGPPLGVGRSHLRSGVPAVAGDPGRGVRRGARRSGGGLDARAPKATASRIPRALEDPPPQTSATEEPGVSEPRARACPTTERRGPARPRGDADRRRAAPGSRPTLESRRRRSARPGQEGAPTEAKGPTHATGTAGPPRQRSPSSAVARRASRT